MKKPNSKTFLFRLAVFLFFVFCISGCTLSSMIKHGRHQEVSVQPQRLEVTGENVLFEVKAQVPRQVLRDKAIYAVELVYQYGANQKEPVGCIAFKPGEFVYEDNRPTITRQFSLTYTPAKNPGRLLVQGVASTPKGRTKKTPWQELATGIVTTSQLIVHHNQVAYASDSLSPVKSSDIQTLTFYFEKGETELKSFISNSLPVLNNFIEANYQTQSVHITAGISPEPAELKNPRLASERAQALQTYYISKLKLSGFDSLNNAISFNASVPPNPWDLLIKKIQHSALPDAGKVEMLNIINSAKSNTEIFEELSKLESADYLTLYIYPTLRFAEVQIDFAPQPRKDYQIYLLSKKILKNTVDREALTPEELRYAATLTPLLTEKQKIYETAVATSDDWQAYHNLGIVFLELARRERKSARAKALAKVAVKNLQYASHRQPTAANFYHLASAQQLLEEQTEALQSYDYALKAGGPANLLQNIFADKAALQIQMGQMNAALASLRYGGNSYQNLMNKGLCYLLKENYEQATGFYEAALKIKPDAALAYYSQAIIAARTKDENLLEYYLQRAVRADKSFTQKAIEDIEFKPYLKNASFQSAIYKRKIPLNTGNLFFKS